MRPLQFSPNIFQVVIHSDILAKFDFRWKVCEPQTVGKTGVILENRMAHKSLHEIFYHGEFPKFHPHFTWHQFK